MLTGNPIALIPRWGKALGEPRPAESVCSLVTTPFKLIYLKPFFPTLLAHSFCDPSHSMWSLSTNVLHLSVKCTAFLEHVPTTTEALDAEKAVPPQFCRRQTLIVFFFISFLYFHVVSGNIFSIWLRAKVSVPGGARDLKENCGMERHLNTFYFFYFLSIIS